MNSSIEDYLKVITPHFHPDLISPKVLSHIQELEPLLSPFCEKLFECRLGYDQTQVDFSFYLPQLTQSLPEKFLIHPVWQAFENFYWKWVDPTSSLHQGVKAIGMEFDLDKSPSPVPIPCIFWELALVTNNQFHELMATAFDLLNYPISPLVESNLKLCANSLPDGARFSHFAVMLSRPGQGVRVNAIDIPPEQLLDYLGQIGWSDPTNTFSPLVWKLSELVDCIVLAFDVGEMIYPRIGLECYLKKQPRYEPRWDLFLDALVDWGLCTPAKRDAMITWPGIYRDKSHLISLKTGKFSWESVFKQSMYSVYFRTINHIKIVYKPGHPLEAKGYLASRHHWLAF